jgi:hypothetical protein
MGDDMEHVSVKMTFYDKILSGKGVQGTFSYDYYRQENKNT